MARPGAVTGAPLGLSSTQHPDLEPLGRATHLMFCTKNLERMGDHATNIAEAVHYMVSGETLLRERPKADFTSMLTVAMGADIT